VFSAASVCLFVSLFVCQHDNFRTIKRRTKKSCPNLNFKVKGQGHWGQKTKKCGILFGSRPLGRGPHAAFFSGAVLRGMALYMGRKISTCCLV